MDATRAWRLWQETVATDPSAADLYLTTVWLDLATAAVTAVLVASSTGCSARS